MLLADLIKCLLVLQFNVLQMLRVLQISQIEFKFRLKFQLLDLLHLLLNDDLVLLQLRFKFFQLHVESLYLCLVGLLKVLQGFLMFGDISKE